MNKESWAIHCVYLSLSKLAAHLSSETFELAFALYDTVGGSQYRASMAYNALRNDALVLCALTEGGDGFPVAMKGGRVAADGISVGSELDISTVTADTDQPGLNSSVVHGSINDVYLVVWEDDQDLADDTAIWGGFVNGDGSFARSNFTIQAKVTSEDFSEPGTAFDPINEQFLVVWRHCVFSLLNDIEGRVVDSTGPVGNSFAASDATADQTDPRVTFNLANEQCSVVFTDYRDSPSDIHGQRLDTDGSALVTATTASCPSVENPTTHDDPDLDFDPSTERFLVTWCEACNGKDHGRRAGLC